MAETKVGIILEAQDRATRQIKAVSTSIDGMNTKLKSLKPTFQKMALIGTASFTALAVGVKKVTDEAGIAEGAYAKFNTVFADGSEDMLAFVEDIRKEMPTATHQIVRMSADLQDLLVPMGVARDKAQDMTKGFLDLANKVGAFNDVAPTEVLEAIKSGLAGSSEPLRRFGIDVLESSLQAEAMSLGLLKAGETFTSLEPKVKAQIRAQALLSKAIADSSDSINGFAENNDSYMRRQEGLKASILETKVALGNAFLPVLDEIQKKLLPIVQRTADWIEANPELTLTIVKVTGIVAGLVAVLGAIGLVLPAVIMGAQALGVAFMFLASNPIILLIGAIVAIMNVLKDQIGALYGVEVTWKEVWSEIASWFSELWKGISDTIQTGVDFLVRQIDRVVGLYTSAKAKVTGFGSNVAGGFNIVKEAVGLAEGGIVTRPTMALIGEGGEPEAVIPLSKLGSVGGGGGITVNINGGNFTSEDAGVIAGDQIIEALQRVRRI